MQNKILLISSHRFDGLDCYDWFSKLPNISDYDIIIFDVARLFTLWAGRSKLTGDGEYLIHHFNDIDEQIENNLNQICTKLLEIFEHPYIIYVLYVPEICIKRETEGYASSGGGKAMEYIARTDDWCPIPFRTIMEKGTTIIVKDDIYKYYNFSYNNEEYGPPCNFVPSGFKLRLRRLRPSCEACVL